MVDFTRMVLAGLFWTLVRVWIQWRSK